jgi:hypothetical protein
MHRLVRLIKVAFGSLARAQERKRRVFQIQLHDALDGKVVVAKYERAGERIILLRSMTCEVEYMHARLLQECESVTKGRAVDRETGSGGIEAFFNEACFVLDLADARPSTPRAGLMDEVTLDVIASHQAEIILGSHKCGDAGNV